MCALLVLREFGVLVVMVRSMFVFTKNACNIVICVEELKEIRLRAVV
jgi:hypothetical protein